MGLLKIEYVNNIVAQKTGNTTCLFKNFRVFNIYARNI